MTIEFETTFLVPWAPDESVVADGDHVEIRSYSRADTEGYLHHQQSRRSLTLPAYLAQLGDA